MQYYNVSGKYKCYVSFFFRSKYPNSTNFLLDQLNVDIYFEFNNKGDSRPRHLQGKGCKHWSG